MIIADNVDPTSLVYYDFFSTKSNIAFSSILIFKSILSSKKGRVVQNVLPFKALNPVYGLK